MPENVTIPKHEYEELMEKAKMFKSIVDEEGLTDAELKRLKKASESKTLTEREARKKHGWFFA